jgi:hypothetical protein
VAREIAFILPVNNFGANAPQRTDFSRTNLAAEDVKLARTKNLR